MRFDDFYFSNNTLFEGGNVTVRKGVEMGGNVEVNDVKAQKIPIEDLSSKQFKELQDKIVETLKELNKAFEEENGKPLFPKLENNIETEKLFLGSTRLMFTKDYKEFKKHKKAVGDIDLQFPTELKDLLKKFLKSSEGKKFGKMAFVGSGGGSPTQINTIFSIKDFPVENIQIDFVPTYWEKGSPTKFSTYAHYSSWEDVKNNIKGAFSKLLMRSLVSSKERLGDIAVETPTGKISTSKVHDNPSMRKFSVDKGVRMAYEPVLDDKGNIKKTPMGKPIYKEVSANKATYERDVDDIFFFVFEEKPKDKELKEFHSFIGILNLMKKYSDKKVIRNAYERFMDLLWVNGQEIEQGEFNEEGIQERDFEIKKAAYDQFVKVFPEFKMNDKQLKNFVKPFYDKLRNKKEK